MNYASRSTPVNRKVVGHTDRHQKGFTLLEVLVAVTLLALSLSMILPVLSGGVNALGSSEVRTRATLLASAKLAELGAVTELSPVGGEGDVSASGREQDLRWLASMTPHEDDQFGGVENERVNPYSATVRVSWDEDNPAAYVELRALKLMPVR